MARLYGGIEAGGTRWNCAVGDGEGTELAAAESFATTGPAETLERAVAFFAGQAPIAALGVGCFGPLDPRPGSPTWGRVTTTPKPGWQGVDVAGPLGAALGAPVAFDTDVNAAALGELRWAAGRGLETLVYLTVGTGIGGGVVSSGRPLRGLLHPEIGHTLIRHDRERDPYAGACPFHGDCLEGLASGTALRERWGAPGEELTDPAVWELEADYLALGLANIVLTVSPQRIVLGGGVGDAPGLRELVRARLPVVLGGYIDAPELGAGIGDYLVAPALGKRSGVLGAIELARERAAGIEPR
jgi:fructokinase